MKRALFTIALVVAIAAGSYALTRGLVSRTDEDPDAWMQREFKLNAHQLAAVEKLEADYAPVCAEHCSLIMQANRRCATAPDDAVAAAELKRLEAVCIEATTQHLRHIAAQMNPEQGRRFLAMMEPKVARRDHDGASPLK